MKLFIAIQFFFQVLCYISILDNQVQELNLYKIAEEDQEIIIWVRFQTQLMFDDNPHSFLIINSQISKDQILLNYQYKQQLQIMITIPDSEFTENLILAKSYDRKTWLCINLLKDSQYQWIKSQNKTIQLPSIKYKDHQFYLNLITWQNLTFSLKAFKGQDSLITQDYFYITNTPILKLYKQIVMNYKSQIQLEMYIRQQNENEQIFFTIMDQEYSYNLHYGQSNIRIKIKSEFSINQKQFQGIPHNKWFKLRIHFELDKTITTINTLSEQFNWVYENKQLKPIDGYIPQYYGIMIQFYNPFTEIDNIIIVNNKTHQIINNCFPGCKKCEQLQCFECKNNLKLSNQCSCDQNQFYDNQIEQCKDITEYPGLMQNQKYIQICILNEYFNIQQEKCVQCPKIDDQYCTDCVYNTDLWKFNKTCTFQEIYSDVFLNYQSINYALDINSFQMIFDQFYTKITNYKCEFQQTNGLIYCKNYPWDYLVKGICDYGQYNQVTHKCKSNKGVFHKFQNRLMCQLNYTLVNFRCVKCPNNCVVCTYLLKTIKCLITNPGFYIQADLFLIQSCITNKTMCLNQTNSLQNQEQQYNDCKLQIDSTCLLCVENYILDFKMDCELGKDVSKAYNFEYLSNRLKQQLTYFQLAQFASSQITIIKKMTLLQILFYGLQYENIKQTDGFIYQNNNSHCVKFNQFNSSKKCYQYKQNFTQLFNDGIYYCPNDKCSYNLTLQIDIFISNSQQILYQNISYISIQEILDLIIIKFYVEQITFMAQVQVFDSFDQECFDQQIFMLNDSKINLNFPNTYFKLILIFQSFSQFPSCWEVNFYSNFQSIQIRNLTTNSLLQIQFQSDEIEFINCKFLSKEQIQIILHAQVVTFENITFIHTEFDNKLIQIFYKNNLIQVIKFLSCNFIDLKIKEEIILIQILSEVKLFVIYNMTLFEVQISDAIFFQFHKFQMLQVEQMFLGQNTAYLSNYFSCELFEQSNSLSVFDNINILDSEFMLTSFIQIQSKVSLQNLKIIDSIFISSQAFNIFGRLNFMNILLQGLQLDKCKFFSCQGEHDNLILKDIKIIDTYFNQTQLLFIKAFEIKIENIQILYCNYYPSVNLFDIVAKIGFIESFSLTSIRIEKQYQQLVVETPEYLLNFQLQQIRFNFVKFENITIFQAKLLIFSYNTAHISNLFIINFQLIGGSLSELILLSEFNSKSYLKLFTFSVINIDIKWLQPSKLFYIQGNEGQSKLFNLVMQNITSITEFQIFYCQKNRAYFNSVSTKFQQLLGFIKQSQSIVKIINYKQIQNHLLSQLWNTPIFSNIDPKSEFERLSIYNSSFMNLVQPICLFRHNKLVIFHIQNSDILQFSAFQNIFTFQLQNYSTFKQKGIVFYLLLEKVNTQKVNLEKLVFLICDSSQVTLNKLLFKNTNIIILQGRFAALTIINDIFIQNTYMEGYSYFYIDSIQSTFYAKNIFIDNQNGNSNVFAFYLYLAFENKIIIQQVFINQCINCLSILIINDSKQVSTLYHLDQLLIKQSNFLGDLFLITFRNQSQFNINNFQIYNTSINGLAQNSLKELQFLLNWTFLINVIFKNQINGKFLFHSSYIFNSTFNGLQIVLINKQIFVNSNQKLFQQPISIGFSESIVFKSVKIQENLQQIYFNTNETVVYVPTGIPLSQFRYKNPITQLQEAPYSNFIIVLNMQSQNHINCSLKQSLNDQPGAYSNMNHFELQNGVNIIENFTFLMNPYLNYSYIQNDVTCGEYTIRFNIKTLPCQLGEQLYQNQCLTCDITKNYYSVTKRAQLCNIINQDQIEQLNVGNIKLRPTFWRAKYDSNKIEQCNNAQCLGGWAPGDQSCIIGYVGALCKECDIYNVRGLGQFAQQNYYCQQCEFNYTIILKGLIVLLWLMFLAYLSFDTNRNITQQYLIYKITQRNVAEILMRQSINQISIIIKIITNYIFYLYLFRDKLTFLYSQVNISFDLISNPTMIIKPHIDCLFVQYEYVRIHYLQLIFTILCPFYTLSIFYLFYLLLLKFRIVQFQFSFILITIYSVYLFNQQLIFQNQIQLLSYNTVSNIQWIYMNQQFQYNTRQHYQMMYEFILPTNLLLLLVPLKDKKSLMTTKFYGILFKEYKLQSYYWEILRIYQKYIIIMFIYSFNSEYILILIQVFLTLLIQNQPYPLKNLNYLEQKSLYILFPTLIDIIYMTHHSNYKRGIQFLVLNIILFYDVALSLIQKTKLQYKDQILKIRTILTQKIPQSNIFINNEQPLRLQQNLIKMKSSYLKHRKSSQQKYINTQGQVILSSNFNTYQISPTEIEMTEFQLFF
ncbi:hypothetical protein pb186bvf_014609 [Paramecium bursaria]